MESSAAPAAAASAPEEKLKATYNDDQYHAMIKSVGSNLKAIITVPMCGWERGGGRGERRGFGVHFV